MPNPAQWGYFFLHRILEHFLNPFVIINGLLVLGWVILIFFNKVQIAKYVLGFILVGFWLLCMSPIVTWMISPLIKSYNVVSKPDEKIKWIVVFSGGYYKNIKAPVNQILGPETIARLLEGIRLYRQIPDAKLILSGGGYQNKKQETEAALMAKLAAWFHIPKQDIILETHSWNTADEAKAIKSWVKKEPFYLVTSSIHMKRSMALCQKQGLAPLAAPSDCELVADLQPWWQQFSFGPENLLRVNAAWHEVMGLIWAKLRGEA